MKPEIVQLQSVIDKLLNNRQNIKVLEAGCGSATEITLPPDAYMVGIDISEKQLERNTILKEKILGDLQTYNLPANHFDIIVCFYVLEHLPSPELALKNFVQSLKEDGIVIIAVPNVLSIWGLTTKLTPHWFHVWVYRNIFGEKKAGTEDFGPFPTYLRYSIGPDSIKQFAAENGLTVEYFALYENFRQTGMKEKFGLAWNLLAGTTKVGSLGKVDPDSTDYIIVMKKQKTTAV